MKCGVAVHCLYSEDWDRVVAQDWSRSPDPADYVKWDEVIDIGDRVEPLGFDSIWSTEHFGTPYGMAPNALQHLAFWAGRTKRIDLGTCCVILPWHHPIQTAHEIAMLDIFLQGRNYTIGLGRGLSPKEFGPLGINRDEARQRFSEAIDIIKLGLTEERFSYDGEIFKIPETSIRPQPRHKDMWNDALGAFMTPTSMEAIAKAGLGAIVTSPQPYEEVGKTVAQFNAIRREAGFAGDSQPVVLMWAYCAETEEDAAAGVHYFERNEIDGALHYGFGDPKTFDGVKGYETYDRGNKKAAKDIAAGTAKYIPGGGGTAGSIVADQQLIGTPDQIVERVTRMQRLTGAREVVVAFNYGAMPHELATKSMELFAREVLPAVKAIDARALEAAVA
jgi:alkanesulfonate monooxygenase SsuD/methylene tetrahydromethanopterin reductase-like flavin-dependent oxidoreductase (luciferase family)